ncbi:MAG: hypothetical protein IPL22_22740 [Bacteroidetes bacterium]|nr:hypothetical protein [Bacteroidota bacterium]
MITWVSLPGSADIGEAIDNAMKLIEDEYDNSRVYCPRISPFSAKTCWGTASGIFNKEVLRKAEGDLFRKIYEHFLNKFAMTGGSGRWRVLRL